MRSVSRYLVAIGAAALLVSATACARSGTPVGAGAPTSQASGDHPHQTVVTATFPRGEVAFNYDKTLVPDGAKVLVAEYVFDAATTVTLSVRGLVPNRTYGAHAHAKPCGLTGEDAGPHFQHMPDPVTPSVDPAYANPTNEIWLDFTTDAHGDATVARTVPWTFTTTPAASVIIHAQPTATAPGKAGTAGARAGCVSVGF